MSDQTADERCSRVDRPEDLPGLLGRHGLSGHRPVVVLVGGAAGMGDDDERRVAEIFRDVLVPLAERHGTALVTGGTDAGVMRLIGRARSAAGAGFPLVGVAVAGLVRVPGGDEDGPAVEPHHTCVVLVPGAEWGDETPWIGEVAAAVAGGGPSATVLANGGLIAYADAEVSFARGSPLIVLAGTGRTADALAEAADGRSEDARAAAIARSPLCRVVPVTDAEAVRAALAGALDLG